VPFESLLGNETALAHLRDILRRDRLGHAYLFSGPEGLGKRTAALEFARAWGADPRTVGVPEDKHEIAIAQIHEVVREFSFASPRRRAVIFDDAHRMSEEAMNALLKTLEEPPRLTLLILVTHRPQALIAPLRSRCQRILFFPLADETVTRYAQERLGLGETEAGAVAALAEGSPGTAASLAGKIGDLLALARELQERVLSGELNPLIETLAKIRDTEEARRAARQRLGILAACLREVLHAPTGRAPCLCTPAFFERMSRLDPDDLVDRIESILDHQGLLDLNVNVGLALEDALLRL